MKKSFKLFIIAASTILVLSFLYNNNSTMVSASIDNNGSNINEEHPDYD
ncbi:hypothetical protein JOC85_003091 [Bacillus mesophilus]|nr:hypothetical protein [Bacillus mesophilus]